MRRVLVLLMLVLTVLMSAPTTLAENGVKFTEVSACSLGGSIRLR